MTQVDKIARLMYGHTKPRSLFDPLHNKSDLMDVENNLHIDVRQNDENIVAELWEHGLMSFDDMKRIANYSHCRFTARSHAVCAVAEMIYDKG